MLTARSFAATCAREIARSRPLGATSVALRAFTDPSKNARSAAEAAAAETPVDIDSSVGHRGKEQQQRGAQRAEEKKNKIEGGGNRGGEPTRLRTLHGRQNSPGAALTTRLKGLITPKGGGPWNLAVHILEKARRDGITDIKAYNVVLKMIATDEGMRKSKLVEMERLVGQIKEDGLEPEVSTYNSLTYAYGQARSEASAVRVYQEMTSRGLQPDRRTLSNMIVAHSWGSIDDMRRCAAELQERGWHATCRANSGMIGSLRRVDDWAGIFDTISGMLEHKQKPTEAAFAVGIKAACHLSKPDFARMLLAERCRARYRPKEELYVTVIVALRNAGRHDECLEWWRELVLLDGLGDVNINDKTYNLVLRAAAKAERWEEMDVVLDMMQAKRIVPTDETYLGMLDLYHVEASRDGTRLHRILGAMRERGMHPSTSVRLRTGVAYTRAGIWENAAAMFDAAIAEGCAMELRATEHLVQSLVNLERHSEVKDIWTRATSEEKRNFGVSTVRRMVTAAEKMADAEWVSELRLFAPAPDNVRKSYPNASEATV